MENEAPPASSEQPASACAHRITRTGWREAFAALVVLGAFCLLVNHCHQPPDALGLDAPGESFSAERAHQVLKRLLADEAAHPVGSTANDQVQERIIGELAALGLEPATSERWASNEHETPRDRDWVTELSRVRNVVAELPSSHPEQPAILLACHYDSVPAGPGAGDDGAAVAALLEVARALNSTERPLARPVILLFTDGEELGLFGAQAFSEDDPLARRVGLVLNFEARGTSGGSLLFETSRNNRWIVRQAAAGLSRPMSSSAYVEIYRLMPNGSDLTVFMDHGMPGMNFAFIQNPKHYHTPLDNLENLDRRSLQHHGDNALGMVRQLLADDWKSVSGVAGDAVYTDVCARWILAWPAAWGPAIAAFLVLTLLVSFVLLLRRHRWKVSRLMVSLLCWISILLFAGLLAWLGAFLLDAKGASLTRMPDAMHFDVGVHCLFGAIGLMVAILIFHAPPALFFMTHGLLLALITLALSLGNVAGFSYLFLLPSAASACGSLLILKWRNTRLLFTSACLIPGFVTAVAWVPLLVRIPLALGVTHFTALEIPVAPAFGVIFALLLMPLTPLLLALGTRMQIGFSLALAGLAAAFFHQAYATPPFTSDAPQQVNLLYLENEGDQQATLVFQSLEGPLPSGLAKDLPALKTPAVAFGGTRRKQFLARAVAVDPAGTPAPGVELLSQNTRGGISTVRIRLRPSLDSQYLMAGIPASAAINLQTVAIGATAIPAPPGELDGHRWIRVRGAPPGGVEVELTWSGPAGWPLLIAGITSGLPARLQGQSASRDALPACPAHRGDQTIVLRRITLP